MAELIVGVNSYMTLEEANIIVNDNYLSNSKENKWWNSLDDNDKKILINKTTMLLNSDSLCGWIGTRVDSTQNLSFPRKCIDGNILEWNNNLNCGLIELLFGINSDNYNEYRQLRKEGISSYKIKDASVSFINDSTNNKNSMKNNVIDEHKDIFNSYFSNYSAYIW